MQDRRQPGSPRIAKSRAMIVAVAWLAMGLLAGADRGRFEPRPKQAGELPLLFQDSFDRGDLGVWGPTDPKAWRIARPDGNPALELHAASDYAPPVRSPLNIALARVPAMKGLGDFVLDLKVRSTGRDYGHRDICLIFGYRDPSHFYYTHLAKAADEHANSIFLVNGAPRVSIARTRTMGTPWTDGWHHVRLVRRIEGGLIEVYFDDMEKPAMTAQDKTFERGQVGVGSFDDTGLFDDIQLWGDLKPEAPKS